MSLQTLSEWNNRLASCNCCEMPVCPPIEWRFRVKSLVASNAYNWDDVSGIEPPECDQLCAQFRILSHNLPWNYTSPVPPLSQVTYLKREYSGLTAWSEEVNPFTADPAVESISGSTTFTETDVRVIGGVWTDGFWAKWTQVPHPTLPDTWRITYLNSDGDVDDPENRFEYETTDPDDHNYVGSYDDIKTVFAGGQNPPGSWNWPSFEFNWDYVVETETLEEQWTQSNLETWASDEFDEMDWTDIEGQAKADRLLTHPITDCGDEVIERPNCIDSWTETRMQYQPVVSDDHNGTYYLSQWDEATTLPPSAPTLVPKQWEWLAPELKVGPWSLEVIVPTGELGTVELANVRATCYDSSLGNLPSYDLSFDKLD